MEQVYCICKVFVAFLSHRPGWPALSATFQVHTVVVCTMKAAGLSQCCFACIVVSHW